MFREEPIYMIGIVLFTLLLLAHLVLYFLIPADVDRGHVDGFGGGNLGGGFASGNSGFDFLDVSDGDDNTYAGLEGFVAFEDKGDFDGMRPDEKATPLQCRRIVYLLSSRMKNGWGVQ